MPSTSPRSPRPAGPYAAGIALLALVLGVAVATVDAQRAAASDDIAQDRTYRVDVTGIQVIDWRSRSSWPLDDLAGWTRQDGSQTLGWRTTRAGVIGGTRYLRRRVGNVTLPPFVVTGATRTPRIRGTVVRRSTITRRAPTPVCEGGSLDDDCLVVPFPLAVPQTCGRKAVTVGVTVSPSGSRNEDLIVTSATEPDDLYPACGPDGGVMGLRPLTASTGRSPEADLDVTFRNAATRLGRLARGRALTLAREVRLGCPLPAADRPGPVDACTTTDVTVELTRTR